MERTHLGNFGRVHYGEYSCEIILNLDQWFRRRYCLKKKFMDGRLTKTKTVQNASHGQFCFLYLNIFIFLMFFLLLIFINEPAHKILVLIPL